MIPNLNVIIFESWMPFAGLRGLTLAVLLIALVQSRRFLILGEGREGEGLARLVVGLLWVEAVGVFLMLTEQLSGFQTPTTLGIVLLYTALTGLPIAAVLALKGWATR